MAAPLKKASLTIFQRFFRTETLGGVVLLAFGLGALIIANSPLAEAYNHLWEIPVLVIALFYSEAIVWSALAGAAVTLLVLIGFNLIGVRHLWPYLLGGVALWLFVHDSGVHATTAGVALSFTIPTHTRINAVEFSREARSLLDDFNRTETGDLLVLTSKGQQEALFSLQRASKGVTAPVLRFEQALHNFSAFVVMPLFAFANAGVKIDLSVQHIEIGLGVLAGLVFGKPVGIMMAALIAVKMGIATLPQAVSWRSLFGYACLAGIGFTMSLFVAMLAFADSALVDAAKRGIIVGSLVAGVAGAVLLRISPVLRDDE